MAPVVKALAGAPGVESHVCVTAQHRQMLDQVLGLFAIRPDVDLDLMRENQSLAALSARIFTELDPVLERIRPDWVLAQGDTTTGPSPPCWLITGVSALVTWRLACARMINSSPFPKKLTAVLQA
jgi:UDP-N-acetylglucosamine 2-epimerase